jgi:hypothetical protein
MIEVSEMSVGLSSCFAGLRLQVQGFSKLKGQQCSQDEKTLETAGKVNKTAYAKT